MTARAGGAAGGGGFVARTVGHRGGASRYAVWVPAAGDVASAGPLPVVLFLHGAGERGTDGVAPTTVGIGPVLAGRPEPATPVAGRAPEMTAADLPPSPRALVVCPQVRPGYDWTSPESVATALAALAALAATLDAFGGDPERQSLTGVSMGGSGAWHLALQHPDRFAALVPVCGWLAGASARAHALAADVRYTEYPGVGHSSWRQAYAEPALYPWLLACHRVGST